MLPAGTASCSGLINALRDHVTMLAAKKDLETKIAERTRHLRQLASDATTPGRGLAITRKLAGLMGGTAGTFCIPEAGNTHWLTVCLRIAEPLATVVTEPKSGALPTDADAET